MAKVFNNVQLNVNFAKESSPSVSEISPGETIDNIVKKTDSSVRYLNQNKADKSIKETGTISTSWSGSSAPYTQVISVTGITSDSVIIISPASTATTTQLEEFAALGLQDGGQSTNSMTIKANGTLNSGNIPISIAIFN